MTGNPPEWEPPPPSSNHVCWYKLKYRKPVLCKNIHEIDRFMRNYRNKRVRSTYIGVYWVSTVFLFLDHGVNRNEPVLFETMVFKDGDMGGELQYRTTTWRKALAMHWKAVQGVKDERYGKL
jgi:hypothetical protein